MDDPILSERTSSPLLIDGRLLVRALVVIIVLLNVGCAVTIAVLPDSDTGKWLYLGLERNPSTWFSSAQLALAAGLAFALGRGRADRGEWDVVALVLLVMSLDETATLHEKTGGLPGIPHVGSRAWLGAGLLLVGAVALRLVPWALLRLEPHLRRGLLAAAVLFVGGAVGLEGVSGSYLERHGDGRAYWALEAIEEDLEMLAVLLVVALLLRELRRTGARLQLGVRA